MEAHNLFCDTNDNVGTPITPTNANGQCAIFPHTGNAVDSLIDQLVSVGQYLGAEVSEHTVVNRLFAATNYTALALNGGSGSNSISVNMIWCQFCTRTVTAVGSSSVNILLLNSEALNSGGADLYDPNNYLYGSIKVDIIDHTPVITGATNAEVCTTAYSAPLPTCTWPTGSTNKFGQVYYSTLANSNTVSFAVTSAAGSGATTPTCSYTAESAPACTAAYGVANFTLGTGPTTGDIFELTWTNTSNHLPICHFDVIDNNSSSLLFWIEDASTTHGLNRLGAYATAPSAPTASHNLTVVYQCDL
jgi:hypothetical protein